MPTLRRDSVTADSVAAKLFEDDADPLKKATLSAILAGGDIYNYQMVAYINGYALHAQRFLNYAREYHDPGLPTGTLFNTTLDPAVVKTAIESDLVRKHSDTRQVIVQSAYFNNVDLNTYAFSLMEDFGWNRWTQANNHLVYNGVNYRYHSFTDNGNLNQAATILYLNLQRISDNSIIRRSYPYPDGGVYGHATYTIVGEAGTPTRYWSYFPDGTHQDVDTLINNTLPFGEEFYPIIPIRIDGKMLSEERHGKLYTTSARALKKLYLKMGDLQDALEGKNLEDDDEKPNMDDIDDSWFMFGLDIYTAVPQSAEYLYKFLSRLHDKAPDNKLAYTGSVDNIKSGTNPEWAFYKISEAQFKMVLQYNYTETKLRQAGDLKHRYENEVTYQRDTQYIYAEVDGDGNTLPSRRMYLYNSFITVKEQNYDANGNPDGTHNEIIMHGPVHTSTVNGSGHRRYVTKYIDADFIDSPSKAGTSGFYLPVSHVALKEVHDAVDREIVLYDSMMLAVYAIHIEKLKWYQTGIFKILLQVVLLVIAVVLAMNFGPPGMSLATAFMEAMVSMIIITMTSIAVQLIIEEVGGTVGAVLAIIVVVAALALGKFKVSFDTFKGLPWFDQIWKASQIFVDVGSKVIDVYVSSETMAIQEEYAELLKDVEEKQEELDKEWDLLGPENSPYDPLYVTQNTTMMNPNETPTDFYDRVLNIGNIVEISLDQCEDYVVNALALPEPDNSDYVLTS